MVDMVILMVKNAMLIADVCMRTLATLRNATLFTIPEMKYVSLKIKGWTTHSEKMLVNLDGFLDPAAGVPNENIGNRIRQWSDSLEQLANEVMQFDSKFVALCEERNGRPGISREIQELFSNS